MTNYLRTPTVCTKGVSKPSALVQIVFFPYAYKIFYFILEFLRLWFFWYTRDRFDNENYNCGKNSPRYALFCRNGRSASRTPVCTREDLVYISEWMFSPLSKSLNHSTVLPKCYLKHILDPLMYIWN